jgi:hypothetical protein
VREKYRLYTSTLGWKLGRPDFGVVEYLAEQQNDRCKIGIGAGLLFHRGRKAVEEDTVAQDAKC